MPFVVWLACMHIRSPFMWWCLPNIPVVQPAAAKCDWTVKLRTTTTAVSTQLSGIAACKARLMQAAHLFQEGRPLASSSLIVVCMQPPRVGEGSRWLWKYRPDSVVVRLGQQIGVLV